MRAVAGKRNGEVDRFAHISFAQMRHERGGWTVLAHRVAGMGAGFVAFAQCFSGACTVAGLGRMQTCRAEPLCAALVKPVRCRLA